MKHFYSGRWSLPTIRESALLIMVFAVVLWFFGVHYLILFLLFLAVMLRVRAINQPSKIIKQECTNPSCEKYLAVEKCAEQRLLFLRRLIDMSMTYEGNAEIFYQKFREAVNIAQIRKEQILDFHVSELDEKALQKVSSKDVEFHLLSAEGFTNRELSVIYNHSNPKSIYVRQSRIRRKIESNQPKSTIA